MPDTTYSFKVSDELKEKLQALIEQSKLSSKDFFGNIINNFELQKAKINTPMLEQDINELQQLTGRISNLFVNISERLITLESTHKAEIERQLSDKDGLVVILQQQIHDLKNERAETELQIEKLTLEKTNTENEINQLQEINRKNDELIKSLLEKNITLTELLNEQKLYKERNVVLEQELSASKKENDKLNISVTELEKSLSDINASIVNITGRQAEEIEQTKKDCELEYRYKILEFKEQQQQAIQNMQNEYNQKIFGLINTDTKRVKKTPTTDNE